MKLKNLDKFYQEIETIDIQFENVEGRTPAMTLQHYAQSSANYDAEVKKMQELALSVILMFNLEQIQFNANRLQLINERLTRFWSWYIEQLGKIRENTFDHSEFMYYLSNYLTINHSRHDVTLSWVQDIESFVFDLHDAVMYKQGYIKHLLFQIKSITDIEPKLLGDSEERAKEEENITSKHTSYTWLSNEVDKELEALYEALSKGYIKDTTLEDFKAAFTSKPINSFKPIRWASDNASELIYFITSLKKTIKTIRANNDWVRLSNCFIKSDGSPFNKGSFKTLYQQLDSDLSQQKRASIDRLLQPFK